MKRLLLSVVILLLATVVKNNVSVAKNQMSSFNSELSGVISSTEQKISDKDFDGVEEQLKELNGKIERLSRVGNALNLKNNKKNREHIESICSKTNLIQNRLLEALWENKDYDRIYTIVSDGKIKSWRAGIDKTRNITWPASIPLGYKASTDSALSEYIASLEWPVRKMHELHHKLSLDEQDFIKDSSAVETHFPLMGEDACEAAKLYWRWYGNELKDRYSSETASLRKQYKTKYGDKYGWDLTEIYGPMYQPYAKDLIRYFWLNDAGFDILCRLDRKVAVENARLCGNNKFYAKAIAEERPEEAYELCRDSKYLELHRQNLNKWGITEAEYKKRRTACKNWDEFYAKMYAHETSPENQRRLAENQEKAREAQIAEEKRRAENKKRDNAILDDYKPRIAEAISEKDYNESGRLAKEALNKMNGGDAYLYYIQALAYYKNTLDFDLDFQENATDYFKAYRDEAKKLVSLCERSIDLDPRSSNDAYFYRGIAYNILGETDAAISDFKRLTGRSGEQGAISQYNIGIAAKNAGRWSQAMDAFKEARNRSRSDDFRSKCLAHIKDCQESRNKQ